MSDLESGVIIVKGINDVTIKNYYKESSPNGRYMPETLTTSFNHLIEINVKENKYRIVYKIIDICSDRNETPFSNLFLNCISFNTIDDNAIQAYNLSIEDVLKKGMMGKERREEYLALSKPKFQDISTTLINQIKATMSSIEKSVSTVEESW